MLLNLRGADGPLYRRIGHALKSAIRSGRLAHGARLPSTRALAAGLGVSRNTVMLAYEQLVAEGYVVSRHRSTTSVAAGLASRSAPVLSRPRREGRLRLSTYGRWLMKDPAMPPSGSYASRPGLRYDFRYGRPAMQEFPRATWRRLLAARARRIAVDTCGYGPPAGYRPLREALAEYLGRSRGMSCHADQIVIVNGSQQALDLAARVLLDPGHRVAIEEPHYHGSRLVFEAAGARLIGVPVDGEGLDPAQLPPGTARARLVCVTPCHQFPTGVIMPVGRRQALLDWASRTGAWVVEDDYVSEFRYEGRPLEALQALDRTGRVIYVGTFSKTLFPALRLAYLVLPRPLVRPFVAAKWMADRYTAMLGQEALTDFITSGHFERYLRRACTRNAGRRRVLIDALKQRLGDRVEIAGENAGVHLLVWLNDVRPPELESLIARAAGVGVGLYPISAYYLRPPDRAGLLFGYASRSEAEIRAGIDRFATVVADVASARADRPRHIRRAGMLAAIRP
jgi:GntR family transcriptional regulator / MocR family aminotransferase